MTRLPLQRTRFLSLQRRLASSLGGGWGGGWRRTSLLLLSLLLGLFAGQTLTAMLLGVMIQRPLVVLALLLVIELQVRLRDRLVQGEAPLAWRMLDNLRIGLVFSVVLEAFKLGS